MECVDGTDLSKYIWRCSPDINHKNEYQVVCHGIATELSFGGHGGFLRMCLQSWCGSQDPQWGSDPHPPSIQVPVDHYAVWAGSSPVTMGTGQSSGAWTKKGREDLVQVVINPAGANNYTAVELRKGISRGWFSLWASLLGLARYSTEVHPWRVGEPASKTAGSSSYNHTRVVLVQQLDPV